MSTADFEFALPEVTNDDELSALIELEEDPKLNDFWVWLLKHRPGTAHQIVDIARRRAGDDAQRYEEVLLAHLKTTLVLGIAAARESVMTGEYVSVDDDESVQPQGELRDDQ